MSIKGSITVGAPLNKLAVPIIYTAPNGDKLTALFSGNDCISITQELPRFASSRSARIKGFFKLRKKEHPKVYKGFVNVNCIKEDPDGFLAWAKAVINKRKG